MGKLKKFVMMSVVAILLLGGAVGGWLIYDSLYFFTTENAQVSADMITLTPEVTGRLKSWDVKEGDMVKLGQVLGRQDVSMLVSSTALNAQALSNTADSLVNKAEIRAPLEGRVVQSSPIKGQVVTPGMELATIADTSHPYIKANIEETDILRIKPGQRVDLWIDAYPGRLFHGYVERIGQATQSAFNTFPSLNTSGEFSKVTQLIPVKVSITDLGELAPMPGLNATVKIHLRD